MSILDLLVKIFNINNLIQQHIEIQYVIIKNVFIYIHIHPALIHELRMKTFGDGDDISAIADRCTSEVARLNYVDSIRTYLWIWKSIFSAGMGHPQIKHLDK